MGRQRCWKKASARRAGNEMAEGSPLAATRMGRARDAACIVREHWCCLCCVCLFPLTRYTDRVGSDTATFLLLLKRRLFASRPLCI